MHSQRLLIVSLLLGATIAWSQEAPKPPTLSEAVRKAVKAKQFLESDNLGRRSEKAAFREIGGEGGVLVGLHVGLARWGDGDVPWALIPIYREGEREWEGGSAGDLNARIIVRKERIVAKPGYAIGGMWLRTGAGIDSLCLHFMRIDSGFLDQSDFYNSAWVGDQDGGREAYLSAGGRPVIGLIVDTNRAQARNMGLIYAKVPLTPAAKDLARSDPEKPAAPAAEFNPNERFKPKLQEEVEAGQPPENDGGGNWLALVAVAAIGLPMIVVSLFVFGRGESKRPRRHPDERAAPSRRRRRPPDNADDDERGRPITERPKLAERIAHDLPATRPAEAKNSGSTPPFFLVRATYRARHERLARIYVLPSEILVIDAGPGSDMNLTANVAAAVVSGGGALGAFIGSAVGSMVAEDQKARGTALQCKLDRLDLPALLQWATEEGNFRAKFSDLVGLEIEPPVRSKWCAATRAVGTLRFSHLRRGQFTFEFLCAVELRGAIALLRQQSEARLIIGRGWDEITAKYIDSL